MQGLELTDGGLKIALLMLEISILSSCVSIIQHELPMNVETPIPSTDVEEFLFIGCGLSDTCRV